MSSFTLSVTFQHAVSTAEQVLGHSRPTKAHTHAQGQWQLFTGFTGLLRHMEAPERDGAGVLQLLEALHTCAELMRSAAVALATKAKQAGASRRDQGSASSSLDKASWFAGQLVEMAQLAQQLFVAAALELSMPEAGPLACECAWAEGGRPDVGARSSSGSSTLSDPQRALLVVAAECFPQRVEFVGAIMQDSREASRAVRAAQGVVGNCAAAAHEQQRQQQRQGRQQLRQQQEMKQQQQPPRRQPRRSPLSPPPPPQQQHSKPTQHQQPQPQPQPQPQQHLCSCGSRQQSADSLVARDRHAFLMAYTDKRLSSKVPGEKQQEILSSHWLHVLADPLCVEHHRSVMRPVYSFAAADKGAGGCSKRRGLRCPAIRCSQCSQLLCSSHSSMLHVCPFGKLLRFAELERLAAAAGCEPLYAGGCFLCGQPAGPGGDHTCSSSLWRLLAVDQAQLPHASPTDAPRVLLQDALVDLRAWDVVVHEVFTCPVEYLPRCLAAKDKQQQMQQRRSWPLLEYLMALGPSSYVTGQRGAFALQPLDHRGGELRKLPNGRMQLGADLQQQLVDQEAARARGTPASGCLMASSVGGYVGAVHSREPDGDDDSLAVSCVSSGGRTRYDDPRCIGSHHVNFNNAHGPSALLEPLLLTFPRADGSMWKQMLLQAVQWPATLSDSELERMRSLQSRSGRLPELTWPYDATTTNLEDVDLNTDCLCLTCEDSACPQKLLTLKEDRSKKKSRR